MEQWNHETINNLKSFLISTDSNNVQLGLEILKGQPELAKEPSVEMILFAVYKLLGGQNNFFANNPDWRAIKSYLGILLKTQLVESPLLSKLMNSSLSFGGQTIDKILNNLNKLAKLTNLELAKSVALVLLEMYHDKFILKFLFLHSTQQEQLWLLEKYCIKNKVLELSRLHLDNKHLPSCIPQLSYLEAINLRGNELTHLPNEWKTLHNLSKLNLAGNPINAFKIELAKGLTALKELDIFANALNQVDFLGALSELNVLVILEADNIPHKLAQIYKALAKLKKLRIVQFFLHKLSDDFLPDNVLDIPYFSVIKSEDNKPLDFSNLLAIAELAYKQRGEKATLLYINEHKN